MLVSDEQKAKLQQWRWAKAKKAGTQKEKAQKLLFSCHQSLFGGSRQGPGLTWSE